MGYMKQVSHHKTCVAAHSKGFEGCCAVPFLATYYTSTHCKVTTCSTGLHEECFDTGIVSCMVNEFVHSTVNNGLQTLERCLTLLTGPGSCCGGWGPELNWPPAVPCPLCPL